MRRDAHGDADSRGAQSTRVVSLLRPEPISGISAWAVRMASTPTWRGRWLNMIAGEASATECIGPDAPSPAGEASGSSVMWPSCANAVEQVQAVAQAVSEHAPCVIVGNDVAHAYIAGAMLRHRGVRMLGVAHTAHEADEDFFERCAPLADRWVAVSQGTAARFGRWLACDGRDVKILPCGVEVGAAAAGDSGSPRESHTPSLRLLYAGRLDKHCKRVLDLAALADALHARGVRFTLTIAGDGSAREELRTAMAVHIAQGRVTLLGRVAPDAMSRLYAMHDVFVLTSAFEGSPVTVAEALAAGCGVAITTGCGGAVDVVTNGIEGFIVHVGDVKEMARRLAGLADDPSAMARIREAACRLARRTFDIERHAEEYATLVAACERAPTGYMSHDAVMLAETWSRVRRAMALLGPCEASDLHTLARWWLTDIGADAALIRTLPMDVPRMVGYAERKFNDAIARLSTAGHVRIAIFGAGRHTRRIADAIASRAEIVAILDDRAGEAGGPPRMIGDRPVVRPAMAVALGVDAIVVSSDEHEQVLANRAREALPQLPLTTMYESSRRRAMRRADAA